MSAGEARPGRGGRIRTRGLRFWRPLLYQPELHPCAVTFIHCTPLPYSWSTFGSVAPIRQFSKSTTGIRASVPMGRMRGMSNTMRRLLRYNS